MDNTETSNGSSGTNRTDRAEYLKEYRRTHKEQYNAYMKEYQRRKRAEVQELKQKLAAMQGGSEQ